MVKFLKETSIVSGGPIVKDLRRRVSSSQCVPSRHVLSKQVVAMERIIHKWQQVNFTK